MAAMKRKELSLADCRRVVDGCSKLNCSHLIELKDDHIPDMLTLYYSELLDIETFLKT
ncbi:MAG: hypothetical protein GQ553_04350 [Nitrosomonadaceae bacterium]|nr:hypothetical protein [Nitrosomonadaceae bacterium]